MTTEEVVVVDTGSIVRHGNFFHPEREYFCTTDVLREVKSKQGLAHLNAVEQFLKCQNPEKCDFEYVKGVASATGDLAQLSSTDIGVVALAVYFARKRGVDMRDVGGVEGLKFAPMTRPPVPTQQNFPAETEDKKAVDNAAETVAESIPAFDGTEVEQTEGGVTVSQEEMTQEEFDTLRDKLGGDWFVADEKNRLVKIGEVEVEEKVVEIDRTPVSCITGDFAMQNVLLSIGLPVTSPTGRRVRQTRRWISMCSGCKTIAKDPTNPFCASCGYPSLRRVPMQVNENGERVILIGNRPDKLRGTIYKLPAQKGGKGQDKSVLLCRDHILMGGRDREYRRNANLREKEKQDASWVRHKRVAWVMFESSILWRVCISAYAR